MLAGGPTMPPNEASAPPSCLAGALDDGRVSRRVTISILPSSYASAIPERLQTIRRDDGWHLSTMIMPMRHSQYCAD